jgi:O-glycosyl hydrolase
MNNQIPAFGTCYKDFTGRLPTDADLILNINNLQTEAEVLQWYIDLNAGGTPHTNNEIKRVKHMLEISKNGKQNVVTQVEPGSIVYWARRYGRVVCKCQVISVYKTDDVIDSFRVKVLDDASPYDDQFNLNGHTIDRVVSSNEAMARKVLEDFGKDDDDE